MEEFRKKSWRERREMPIEELVKYYAEERKYALKTGKQLSGIQFRKWNHFFVRFVLKVDQLMSGEKIIILGDLHKTDTGTSRIYACTHIGGNDVQRALQVIHDSAYLMIGNPGIKYRNVIYQGLKLNGVIPLETGDREDRKVAYARSVELLKKGGNLLIFPEAAWNISPNLTVKKIFTGAVRMAKETGSEIVPVAVEQYGKTLYFNIGENYRIPQSSDQSTDDLTAELRDKLVTLKWKIMETQPPIKRKDVPHNYIDAFQAKIIGRCNFGYGISVEDTVRESFHDRHIHEPEEVFEHLHTLIPSRENAFLLRER